MTHDPRSNSWNLQAGDLVVPHCTVRRRLGGGTSYETYDAVDDRLFTPVVIKVLRPHLTTDRAALTHLRREIALIELLRHPLIVRTLHHDDRGERPYIALEKLPGSTVEQLMSAGGPLAADRVVDLGMGLCAALHYLRTVDVIHLDIIPRNVMLADRVPRLIDFDLARTSAQAAALTGPTGSPRCRAPEQCDPPHTGVATTATDAWGLGMTLHMAATAAYPFAKGTDDQAATPEERFPQLNGIAPPLPESLPKALRDVVSACLAPDPADRPTPRDAYFALQDASADGDTSVRRGRSSSSSIPADADDRKRFEAALRAKAGRRRRSPG